MRRTAAGLAVAGVVGLSALAGGVVLGPTLAGAQAETPAPSQSPGTSAAPETSEERTAERSTRIREELQALVDAGTISAEQADEVAAHLAAQLPQRGPGGRGGHGGVRLGLETAAGALGVTEDELRTALADGQSLADVAEAQGVEVDALVSALVTEAQERLAAAVEEGRLTQEQADERAAELQERVTALVERAGQGRHGPHNRDDRADGSDDDGADGSGDDGPDDSDDTESSTFRTA